MRPQLQFNIRGAFTLSEVEGLPFDSPASGGLTQGKWNHPNVKMH